MLKFSNYSDLQSYISKIITLREQAIVETISHWNTLGMKSEMFVLNSQGKRVIDIYKAKNHLKLVELYNTLLDRQLDFKRRLIIKPPLRSICPRNNAIALKKYEDAQQKENQREIEHEKFIEYANGLIHELKLPCSLNDLQEDFSGERQVVKLLFRKIFRQYGIELDDKVVNNIFGKIKAAKEKEPRDTISFFTYNSRFGSSLRSQFSMTVKGQAYGIFSAFFMRAAGILSPLSNEPNFEEPLESLSERDNNPFLEEKPVLRILAAAHVCSY